MSVQFLVQTQKENGQVNDGVSYSKPCHHSSIRTDEMRFQSFEQ